jgi:type II secretory pathway pseudopilin PulG
VVHQHIAQTRYHFSKQRGKLAGNRGFTIAESIIMAVLIAAAASVSAQALISASRMATSQRREVRLNNAVESYLNRAREIGDRFTCCSGTCTVNPPAANTTFDGGRSTSSCATNDPRDDRYFFPLQDDPNTTGALMGLNCVIGGRQVACSREPEAVTEVCKAANNNLFMTPLQNAVNALAPPPGTRVTTAIQPQKRLRITITDTTTNRVIRLYDLYPPMARWCP